MTTRAFTPKSPGCRSTLRGPAVAAVAGAVLLGLSSLAHAQEVDAAALEALIAAAQAEGELQYYASEPDDVNDPVIEAFTDAYGIRVSHIRLSSGQLTQRFAAEREAGVINADVLDVADPSLFNGRPEWFVTLSPEVVPGLAVYPAATDTTNGWREKFVDLRSNLATVQYNTELVTDPPQSWTDLLDPKYKGKILLTSPKASPSYMGWAELMRRYYGIEYLHGIRAQEFALVNSAAPGGQQVAAGAYELNFPAAVSHSLALMQQGAPIGRTIMTEPAYGPEQGIGIIEGGPNPAAARLFVHFMLQPETQNLICELTGGASVLGGTGPGEAEKCIVLPENIDRLPYDILGDPAVTEPLLEALGIQ